MTGEQAWEKHVELNEKLKNAELRFATAILNLRSTDGERLVTSEFMHLFKERLFSRYELRKVEQEYIENLEYLDSIGYSR